MSSSVSTSTKRTVNSDGSVTVITKTEEITASGEKIVTERTSTTPAAPKEQKVEGTTWTRNVHSSISSGPKTTSTHSYNETKSSCAKTVTVQKGNNKTTGETKFENTNLVTAAQILQQHNDYRAKHGVQALQLDEDMRKCAQEWAEQLARANRLEHRKEAKYGENVFMGYGINTQEVVKTWYDEIRNYNFNCPGYTSKTGHFTQVVWKSSSKLGVGIAESESGSVFIVANYDPAGNDLRQYADNVMPLI